MHDTPPLDGRDEEDEPVEDPLRDKARRRRKADFVRRPVVPAGSRRPCRPSETRPCKHRQEDDITPSQTRRGGERSDEQELALEELFKAAIVSSRAHPPSS